MTKTIKRIKEERESPPQLRHHLNKKKRSPRASSKQRNLSTDHFLPQIKRQPQPSVYISEQILDLLAKQSKETELAAHKCSVCNVTGFLPRDPLPMKPAKTHKSKSSKHHFYSNGQVLPYMKPRASKKAVNLMAQASELQYMLYECSKCAVVVHAKCCGGSFPSIHYPKIDRRHEAKRKKGDKENQWFDWYSAMFRSVEWMCDYCCEEEDRVNQHEKCEICRVITGTSEIMKVVKPEVTTAGGGGGACKVINLAKETTYAHLFCAFWFVEVEATDMANLDSIVGIGEIKDEHADKECSLCRNKNGAKLKCSERSCDECFHPVCGKIRGNQFFQMVSPPCQGILRVFFCPTHSSPFLKSASLM